MNLSDRILLLRIIIYGFLIFIIFLIFYLQYIEMYLEKATDTNLGMIYSILGSIILGMYMNSIGFDITNKKSQILLIIAVVFCILISTAYFGLCIRFNTYKLDNIWDFFNVPRPLEANNYIQTNSEASILFLDANFLIFSVIWLVHFPFEHENVQATSEY